MKSFYFKKNIILIFLLFFSILLQIKINLFFNNNINFVFCFLIVSIFFVNYLELVLLSLIAILFINWKPSFNLEIILLFFIIQFLYLIFKISKLNRFLILIFSLIGGNILFYSIINYKFLLYNFEYFIKDLLFGLLFGLLIFYLLKFLNYER